MCVCVFGKYVIICLVLGVLGRKKQVKDVSVFCLAGGWALRMTMINSLISFARTVSWMQGQLDHTCCLVQILSTLNAPQPTNMLVSFRITVHKPSLAIHFFGILLVTLLAIPWLHFCRIVSPDLIPLSSEKKNMSV